VPRQRPASCECETGLSSWASPSTGGSFGPDPEHSLDFKDRVRSRTRRKAPISMAVMIEQLNPLLRGWGSYYAIGDVVSLFEDLDQWIRMRLRSKARKRFKSKGGVDNLRWPNRAFDRTWTRPPRTSCPSRPTLARIQGTVLGEPDARPASPVLTVGLLVGRPGAYPLLQTDWL
jgi:hypothetical protein